MDITKEVVHVYWVHVVCSHNHSLGYNPISPIGKTTCQLIAWKIAKLRTGVLYIRNRPSTHARGNVHTCNTTIATLPTLIDALDSIFL